MLWIVFISVLAACGSPDSEPNEPNEVSFAGKRVTVIVNFGAGGATDQYARNLAPYLSKHLPGNPTVLVENKPGADGILGAAYLFRQSRPDGLTICLCNGLATRWATRKNFPIDVESMGVLGSAQQNSVLVVSSEIKVTTVDELSTYEDRLLYASHSPIAANSVRMRTLLNEIGRSEIKAIGGFLSAAKSINSVQRGETQATVISAPYYLARKQQIDDEGLLTPLAQSGYRTRDGSIRRSVSIDLPTYEEVWRNYGDSSENNAEWMLFSAYSYAASIQVLFALPPATEESVHEIWSDALERAFLDPEYLALRERLGGSEVVFNDAQSTTENLAALKTLFLDPFVIEALTDYAPALRK